jgi:5-formyltetrahydrofolate cyclo-ligase
VTKREIRDEALSRRDELSKEERSLKSRAIFERLSGLEQYINADTILVYASMRSEVETDGLILDALSRGKRVFCPKTVDTHNGWMVFVEISSPDELKAGYYGIREPELSQDFHEEDYEPDRTLVIMPGVAFDNNRNRIGYSGGYYDRFLGGHPFLQTVALSFDCQVTVEDIPSLSHDIKPELVVTESRVF